MISQEPPLENFRPLPLSCDSFGGKYADQYNALRSAMTTAARLSGHEGEFPEYEWLEKTPRTSIVVELVNALHAHGFYIEKKIALKTGLYAQERRSVAVNRKAD